MATQIPIVHGNGFIILPLWANTRLHVWHPDIPRQGVYTGIHDHRFSFVSRVICGEIKIRNKSVTYVNSGEQPQAYRVYHAKPNDKEDTVLVPTYDEVIITSEYERVLHAGETQVLSKGAFHEVVAKGKAATIMTKFETDPEHRPRVLCPVGMTPDNSFNRYDYSIDFLYGIINDVLYGCKTLDPKNLIFGNIYG